ncbi:MAG TPA: sulfotransferase [Rhizomicrobium sp.]|nr:sulfotransferase [Rhizomicrobium sp.]
MDVGKARKDYDAAVALHRQGRLAEAESLYQAVRRGFPNHPGVLHGLGLISNTSERYDEAAEYLEGASKFAPQDASIRTDLAVAFLKSGRFEEALTNFRKVLTARPDDRVSLAGVGSALNILGRPEEAGAAFERLIELDQRNAAAHFGLSEALLQRGRTDVARQSLQRAIALEPKRASYHRASAELGAFTSNDPRLPALNDLLHEEASLPDDQKVELHFALAKAYDDLSCYEEAFEHLARGNAIKRSHVQYDEAAVTKALHEIATAFSKDVIDKREGEGFESDLPIFIVGMPRSGSTLVEQILASHPDVFGAGELLTVNELITGGLAGEYPTRTGPLRKFSEVYVKRLRALSPSAKRVIDKLPANFRHLGLIHLALPGARIIHVHRDPADTCFSCYSKLFLNGLNFTYDLGELGRYYKMYEKLMAHWREVLPPDVMLDVRYETLAGDLEGEARRIVAFCGLDWDERCLRFYENPRAVRTLSQAQVRQPLFTSSIGRWRNYQPWLGPLLEALR